MTLRSFKITMIVLVIFASLIALLAATNEGTEAWLNLIAVLIGAIIIGGLTLSLGRDIYP
jgi:hypothetical protein